MRRISDDVRPLRPHKIEATASGLRPLRPACSGPAPSAGRRTGLAIVVGLVFVALPAAAGQRYAGSMPPFLLFEGELRVRAGLADPAARGAMPFTFLAVLLFLGFWVKFNLHTVLGYPFSRADRELRRVRRDVGQGADHGVVWCDRREHRGGD